MRRLTLIANALSGLTLLALPQLASATSAANAMQAFADHCFRPTMTAARADRVLGGAGTRYDFYDLDPLVTSNAPSPATLRPVTPKTDRRCEVSFDGNRTEAAAKAVTLGLHQEGLHKVATVPSGYRYIEGATFVGARQLNPRRVAVVIVGTRQGPNGVETYMTVERLKPTGSTE